MTQSDNLTRQKRARRLWTLAFVGWLCVVWGHSLMPGDLSSFESSRFLFLVRPFFELVGNHDEQLMTLVIRKTAHFSEYAILAMIGRKMAVAWLNDTRAAWALSGVLAVLAPCVDEAIQLSTPGRAGMLTDVLIDIAGGAFGLCLLHIVQKRRSA